MDMTAWGMVFPGLILLLAAGTCGALWVIDRITDQGLAEEQKAERDRDERITSYYDPFF